jgi:hypothetical protein
LKAIGRHALGRRGNGIISEWQRRFDDAIVLPDGGELVTLLDAGIYIESLPEAQYRRREWRIATEMLLAVADGRWPPRFAEIAIRQALKTGRPPPLPPARRKAKKLKIISCPGPAENVRVVNLAVSPRDRTSRVLCVTHRNLDGIGRVRRFIGIRKLQAFRRIEGIASTCLIGDVHLPALIEKSPRFFCCDPRT